MAKEEGNGAGANRFANEVETEFLFLGAQGAAGKRLALGRLGLTHLRLACGDPQSRFPYVRSKFWGGGRSFYCIPLTVPQTNSFPTQSFSYLVLSDVFD